MAQAYVDIEEAVHRMTTVHSSIRFLRYLDESLAKTLALMFFAPLYLGRSIHFLWLQRGWTWQPMRIVDGLFTAMMIVGVGNFGVRDYLANNRSSLGGYFLVAIFLFMAWMAWMFFRLFRMGRNIQIAQSLEGQRMRAALKRLNVDDSSDDLPPAASSLVLALRHLRNSLPGLYAGSLNVALRRLQEWRAVPDHGQWLANRSIMGLLSFAEKSRLERWMKVNEEVREMEGHRVSEVIPEISVYGIASAQPLPPIDNAGWKAAQEKQRGPQRFVAPFDPTGQTLPPMSAEKAAARANEVMGVQPTTLEMLTMRNLNAGQRSLHINPSHAATPAAESFMGLQVDVFEMYQFLSRVPPYELESARTFEEAEAHGGKLRYFVGDAVRLAPQQTYDHINANDFIITSRPRSRWLSWMRIFIPLALLQSIREKLQEFVDRPTSWDEYIHQKYQDFYRFLANRAKTGGTIQVSLDPEHFEALSQYFNERRIQFSDRLISKLLTGIDQTSNPIYLLTIGDMAPQESYRISPQPIQRPTSLVDAVRATAQRRDVWIRLGLVLYGALLFLLALIVPHAVWLTVPALVILIGAAFMGRIETRFHILRHLGHWLRGLSIGEKGMLLGVSLDVGIGLLSLRGPTSPGASHIFLITAALASVIILMAGAIIAFKIMIRLLHLKFRWRPQTAIEYGSDAVAAVYGAATTAFIGTFVQGVADLLGLVWREPWAKQHDMAIFMLKINIPFLLIFAICNLIGFVVNRRYGGPSDRSGGGTGPGDQENNKDSSDQPDPPRTHRESLRAA